MAKEDAQKNEQLLDGSSRNGSSLNKWMSPNSDPIYEAYYEECLVELAAMKRGTIGDTVISYFSLLVEPVRVVAAYARNENLVRAFNASNYEQYFPIYQALLLAKLNEGLEERKLLESAAEILSRTLRFADPTFVAFDIILKCLSREEIKIIVRGA